MWSSVGSRLIADKFASMFVTLSVNRSGPIPGTGGEQVLIGIHVHDGAAKGMGQFVGRLLNHLHGYRRLVRVEVVHFTRLAQQILICCEMIQNAPVVEPACADTLPAGDQALSFRRSDQG